MVNVMIALRIGGYVLTMYNNRIQFELAAIFNDYYSDHSMRSGLLNQGWLADSLQNLGDLGLMAVLCKHKSNVIDDCTNSCTKVIVLLSDTFEESRKLIYYL